MKWMISVSLLALSACASVQETNPPADPLLAERSACNQELEAYGHCIWSEGKGCEIAEERAIAVCRVYFHKRQAEEEVWASGSKEESGEPPEKLDFGPVI